MDLQIVCTIYSGFLYSCIFPLFLELFSLTSLLPEKRNVQYKKYEKLEMVCPVFFFAFYVCFFFKCEALVFIRTGDLPGSRTEELLLGCNVTQASVFM